MGPRLGFANGLWRIDSLPFKGYRMVTYHYL